MNALPLDHDAPLVVLITKYKTSITLHVPEVRGLRSTTVSVKVTQHAA